MGIKGEEGKIKRGQFFGLLLLLLCERINKTLSLAPFVGTLSQFSGRQFNKSTKSMGDLPFASKPSMHQRLE